MRRADPAICVSTVTRSTLHPIFHMTSIAVSAVVQPSRILSFALASMCAGAVLIGLATVMGSYGGAPAVVRWIAGALCIGAGLMAARRMLAPGIARRIDIFGSGQIRVSEHGSSCSAGGGPGHAENAACLWQLLPTSTLWSSLMILNLRSEHGARVELLILPDTMSQTSFRALSVACHWIAAHNNRAGSEIS